MLDVSREEAQSSFGLARGPHNNILPHVRSQLLHLKIRDGHGAINATWQDGSDLDTPLAGPSASGAVQRMRPDGSLSVLVAFKLVLVHLVGIDDIPLALSRALVRIFRSHILIFASLAALLSPSTSPAPTAGTSVVTGWRSSTSTRAAPASLALSLCPALAFGWGPWRRLLTSAIPHPFLQAFTQIPPEPQLWKGLHDHRPTSPNAAIAALGLCQHSAVEETQKLSATALWCTVVGRSQLLASQSVQQVRLLEPLDEETLRIAAMY
mmetsp:Transcript_36338/g.96597  ORF Transcript_36338/g.96597 Transcript_36338/m.96597 type:complete len:266 (-) Transcript_36338:535-1332(-)